MSDITKKYDNNNSGVLFRNNKKDVNDPEDKKPEYTGQAEINGVEYWISAWKRVGKNSGTPFQSIKFEPKEQKNTEPERPTFIENKGNEGLPF